MGTGAIRVGVNAISQALRLLVLCQLLLILGPAQAAGQRGSDFKSWTNFKLWTVRLGLGGETVLTSPVVTSAVAWDELVPSWNAATPGGTGIQLEARAVYPGRETKWYSLGTWSESGKVFPRTSLRGQKDDDGDVVTDTLRLTVPAWRVQLRLTLAANQWEKPNVRFLGISLWDRDASRPPLAPNREAWGKKLEVRTLSQGDYPGGESSWCSPTSVAMVLSYWARELKRPEIAMEVPQVAAGVMDPAWPGTGNWSFNVAYAGSFPGLRAYVTRLTDISELETWVVAGVPPIVSLNYDTLRNKPPGRDTGHLMVVVGFTAAGDPILNDPGTRDERQRAFARLDFLHAWDHSGRTAYIIKRE